MSTTKTTSLEQIILNSHSMIYLANRLKDVLGSFEYIQRPDKASQDRMRAIRQKLKETAIETETMRDSLIEFCEGIGMMDDIDVSYIQPIVNMTKMK